MEKVEVSEENLKEYYNNTRKPVGILGKQMVEEMNSAHAAVSDWGLEQLRGISPKRIIDIGCGGGRNVGRLLEIYASAEVTGLDYSSVSTEKTEEVNQAAVAQGRCTVVQGDVSQLQIPDGSYDLATAFETVYFWPGPQVSFQEVYRILKPGGTFAIVNDTDGTKEIDKKWMELISGMNLYSEYELQCYLLEVGFSEVEIRKEPANQWICVMGKKGNG